MMNSSSSSFVPLHAAAAVPNPRAGRPVRPSFIPDRSAAATARADAVPATPARFVPLVDADEETATLATREQARAAGFAAGFAAGSREAAKVARAEAQDSRRRSAEAEAARSAEHDQAMHSLSATTRAVLSRQAPVLDECESRLFTAALELATAVIGVELSDAVTSARAALARVQSVDLPGEVTVRLNPRDADVVGEVPAGLRIVVDASVKPGDAIAQHAEGEIDARIASALARATAALAELDQG